MIFSNLFTKQKKQHEMARVKYSLSHVACRITFMNNKVTPLVEHLTLDGSMNQKMWYLR